MDNNVIRQDLGPATAYAMAVEGGYQGTEEEFETDMGNSATNAATASAMALKSEGFAVGKQNGTAVQSGSQYHHNNAEYFKTQAEEAKTEAQTAAQSASAAYGTNLLAPNYSTEETYNIGEHVIYNGGYYVCISEVSTPETWTAAHWKQESVGGENEAIKESLDALGLYRDADGDLCEED